MALPAHLESGKGLCAWCSSDALLAARAGGSAVAGAGVPVGAREPAVVVAAEAVCDIAIVRGYMGVGVDRGQLRFGVGEEVACVIDDAGRQRRSDTGAAEDVPGLESGYSIHVIGVFVAVVDPDAGSRVANGS